MRSGMLAGPGKNTQLSRGAQKEWRAAKDGYARWSRMTDLLRWGNALSPNRPLFRAVAKRTLAVSRSALDAVSPALPLAHPLGAAVVIITISISTFCAVGYVHYKHAANDERVAAQRAERANSDLQDALDRLRDELAATKSRIDTPGDNGKGQTAVSEHDKSELITQFAPGLEQPRDLQLSDPERPARAIKLKWEPRSQGSLGQSRVTVEQLSAECDEAVGERDQLRARVSELEQKLSLLQSRRGLRPVAKAASVRTAFPDQVPPPAAADASASPPTADVPAIEHPRQVAVMFPDKNFTPPGWVPTNFSNESSPIRGNQFHRPAEGQR
jgi:hypothetical protein